MVVRLFLAAVAVAVYAGEAWANPSGSSYSGGAGFLRSYAAGRTEPGVGILKLQSGFFLANNLMIEGYNHKALDGAASYTYAPSGLFPLNRLEVSLATDGRYHPFTIPGEPSSQNSIVGNWSFGMKLLGIDTHPYDLAVAAYAHIFVDESQLALKPASLSPTYLLLQSVDIGGLLVHLNLGAFFDNSEEALVGSPAELNRPFRFAQGMFVEDSWVLGLTAEVPVRKSSAYLELFTYQDMDGKALSSERSAPNSPLNAVKKVNYRQNPIWLTPGLKARVGKRWVVDGALDVGLLSGDFPGPEDREILPPWRFVFGVAYLTGIEDRGWISYRDVDSRGGGGYVAGRVLDAWTGEPLSDVEIRFSDEEVGEAVTIPGGHFEYEHIPPGKYSLEARADDYDALSREIRIEEGSKLSLSLPLIPTRMSKVGRALSMGSSSGIAEYAVHFELNDSTLNSRDFTILNGMKSFLEENPGIILRIEGHTDGLGEFGINQRLSRDRAVTVADYLAEKGIDRKRLVPVGLGPKYPVGTNATDEGRRRNRRVDFRLLVAPDW